MITMKKRLIAIICCVAVLFAGLYVSQPQSAEAADASGTMSITSTSYNFNLVKNGGEGFMNLEYTGIPDDYQSAGANFLDAAFAEQYITYGGGMTYENLMDGMHIFYVATSNILQLNWANRTATFTPGWSFSIAQGALLPYTNTNGTTSYMELDKEYTFTFKTPTDGIDCNVEIVGRYTTTFSLNTGIFGTGSSETGAGYTISFTDDNVADYDVEYQSIHDNSEYASYVNFNGVAFEELAATGLQLRYVLDNGRFIQILNWGTFAGPNGMKAGDQFVFKKGLPIYYVVNGVNYKATLDATYIYECTGPNYNGDAIANYQVFLGCKVDDVKTEFGLNTIEGTNGTFGQNRGYTEWAANLMMDTSIAGGSCGDILAKPYSREFVEFKGITYEQAKKRNILMSLHGSAPCIQLGFTGNLADSDLPVGTQIILKKGFPITWNTGAIQCAVLNDSYVITLEGKTAGSDGNYQWSVRLYDTYKLTTAISGPATEWIGYYYALPFETSTFSDIYETGEPTMSPTVWTQYLTLSNHPNLGQHTDATPGEQRDIIFKYYTYDPTVYRGIRIYCNSNTEIFASLQDGEIMMLKAGLPITYTTTAGKLKNIYLDKDYGFVYNASTQAFTYDSSLGNTDSTQTYTTSITSKTITGIKLSTNYALNIVMTDAPDLSTILSPTEDYQEVPLLSNDTTAPYIDICGIDATTLVNQGVQVTYIPTENVFQLVLGTDYTWLNIGDEITFKSGMPIPVVVGNETVTVTLQNTITYQVESITTDAPYVTMSAYAETVEFYINGQQNDGIKGDVNYTVLDAEGKATILDDCAAGGAYDNSKLSYATIAKYMDFCGYTASELESYGVGVRLAAGDGNEILQIQTGTMPADMIVGETVIFKKGLPLTYTTTEGYKKTITLAKDYTFVVGEGITADGVTYDCRWLYTETEPSIWRLKSGVVNQVLQGDTEGYFNNLELSSSPLLVDQNELDYTFTAEQMEKYIDFADLDASEYNIQAIAIITANDQVVQLRWGTASNAVQEGATVTLKAGLPIVVNDRVVYKLETDIVYTIEKSANGKNGFCLSNIVEVTKTQSGDADGDYILNVNDVNLIREALAELVITDVDTQDATEDDKLDSRDLVRAKANFDIEESEANGTETYTLLAEKEIGFQKMGASTDDRKAVAKSITYDLNADLGTKNYLRLTYKTDTDLRGEFIYTVNGGAAVTEEFFLEADEAQFEQFLDVYRSNGLNGVVPNGSIVLKQIVLYNVSTTSSTNVRLYKVEAAARTLVTNDMLWAQDDEVKIGVDLNMGGSLTWMECLKYEVYEYFSGNESIIGTKEQCEVSGGTAQMTDGVNLINIHDLGRQIQQSYYSVPTGQQDWDGNTFARGSWTGGSDWPYNPVQAGDSENNQSQIVDYRTIDTDEDDTIDVIYVKTRAMDWADAGQTTDSYMEAWYRINDALVYVDNRFIDWSGYNYSVEDKTQELPAVYLGQGLNTLVSDKAGVAQKDTNLGSWTESGHYVNNTTTTDWYAFVNSEENDAFGVGIYVPNVEQTVAGRVKDHRNYKTWWTTLNRNAAESPMLELGYSYLNALYKNKDYQNCFVGNTSYIAPICSGWMQGYEDYSYTYVLTADTLNNISGSFTTLKENNAVDNSSLKKWEINPN